MKVIKHWRHVLSVLDISHCNRRVNSVSLLVCFQFPTTYDNDLPSVYILWWSSQIFFFCPFLNLDFFLLMSCKYSWHILNTSPFIKYEFCNYFLPACVLYFLLTVSFPKQILISRRADLSSISFMDCAFGIVPKNSSPYPTSLRFYVIFHKFYSFVFYIYMKF